MGVHKLQKFLYNTIIVNYKNFILVEAMVKRTCTCIFTYTRDWNTTTTTYEQCMHKLVSLFLFRLL